MDIFKTKMEASGFKNVIINPVEIERGPVAVVSASRLASSICSYLYCFNKFS